MLRIGIMRSSTSGINEEAAESRWMYGVRRLMPSVLMFTKDGAHEVTECHASSI
jgi:hypothetical protein